MQLPDPAALSLADILSHLSISHSDYESAVAYIQKRTTIMHHRTPSEVNISPYNTVILMTVKSNMNIQFVTGIYALLTYLISYLCKPEHTMSELMKKAAKEAGTAEVQQKMHKVGQVFITKREVSEHEAIKRVLSLPLRRSNIALVFIPTGPRKDMMRLLKPAALLKQMPGDETDIYMTSVIDRYEARPDSLEQMCLAGFATNFVTKYADTEVYLESHTTQQSEIIQLKNGKGRMRRRCTPCVICYHKVPKLKNSELFFFNLLQLYLPWRQESGFSSCHTSFEDTYHSFEKEILLNMAKHEPFSDINFDDFADVIPDIIDSGENAESAFPNLHPDLLCDDSVPHSHTTNPAQSSHTSSGLSDDAFYAMCAQLNDAQYRLFNFIMTHTVELLLNESNDLPQPSPFYIFLSGGAGVGKSFLVKAITQYMKRMLRYHAQKNNQPSVAVTASTSKTATNIDGNTLHSAFNLIVSLAMMRCLKCKKYTCSSKSCLWTKRQWLEMLPSGIWTSACEIS